MSDDIAIRVENLGKMYRIYDRPQDRLKQMLWGRYCPPGYGREFWALRDFSCAVRKGEMLGILGRNGSGKSTLLQMVAGTLQPTTGMVEKRGRVSALLELGSGFNPDYSGRDNVFIAGAILGISASEMAHFFEEIVDFAGIGQFIDQPVKTYSSGMTVRLAFAVNASVNPEILIVDEALAVGDAAFVAKCFRRFHEIRARGATVILVTHDVATVIQLCDRALVLHHGQQVAYGSPKTMADEYRRFCSSGLEQTTQPAISQENNNVESSGWCEALPTRQEYGDGGAKILTFAMRDEQGKPTTKFLSGQECTIHMRIMFFASCMAPIAAWGIRDMNGDDLCGTNTLFEKIPIGQMANGETIDVRFKFRILLQSGIYHLCLACTELEGDGLRVLHRMYDVGVFEVHATKQFVGRFGLDCETHLIRGDNA